MFGGSLSEFLSGMIGRVREQVPGVVYEHATQANLVDTALAAVVRQAVRSVAGEWLQKMPLGGAAGGALGSLLGSVAGAFGGAEGLGVGSLIQQALDSTDLDEQLRDALVDGLSKYLRDNAGRLAKVALVALQESARELGKG